VVTISCGKSDDWRADFADDNELEGDVEEELLPPLLLVAEFLLLVLALALLVVVEAGEAADLGVEPDEREEGEGWDEFGWRFDGMIGRFFFVWRFGDSLGWWGECSGSFGWKNRTRRKEITRCAAKTSQIEDSKNITIGAVVIAGAKSADLRE
jgi:hypothetical protein